MAINGVACARSAETRLLNILGETAIRVDGFWQQRLYEFMTFWNFTTHESEDLTPTIDYYESSKNSYNNGN